MPTQGRTVAGILLGFSFTLGQLILAGVAYLIRPWRWLQFAVSVPFLIFFLCSWYVLSRVGGRMHLCGRDLTCPSGRLGVCSDGGLLHIVGPQAPESARGRGRLPRTPSISVGLRTYERFYLHQLLCASQQLHGTLEEGN